MAFDPDVRRNLAAGNMISFFARHRRLGTYGWPAGFGKQLFAFMVDKCKFDATQSLNKFNRKQFVIEFSTHCNRINENFLRDPEFLRCIEDYLSNVLHRKEFGWYVNSHQLNRMFVDYNLQNKDYMRKEIYEGFCKGSTSLNWRATSFLPAHLYKLTYYSSTI